ncbi:MAG: hypothetical protein OEX97_14220 [Acidimicrobiia bacterium]|nr:hypothetical protein [Acidimicrobiia bacterium]
MTAPALEAAAARMRVIAARIEGVIASYLDPAVRLLPQVWIGPAADQLELEMLGHRASLLTVAANLRSRANGLDGQAAEIRAGEAALAANSESFAGAI